MEKERHVGNGDEKKGTKLQSILDKLRPAIPDVDSSTYLCEEREDSEESESILPIDNAVTESAHSPLAPVESTSEERESTVADIVECTMPGVGVTENIEAITIEDDESETEDDIIEDKIIRSADSNICERENAEVGESFRRMSSMIVIEDSEKTPDDTASIYIIDDDGKTPNDDSVMISKVEAKGAVLNTVDNDIKPGQKNDRCSPISVQSLDDEELPDVFSSVLRDTPSGRSEGCHSRKIDETDINGSTGVTVIPLEKGDQIHEDFPTLQLDVACQDDKRICDDPEGHAPAEDEELSDMGVKPDQTVLSTGRDDAEMSDVESDAPVTVVPLDDEGQFEIESVVGDDGERLVTVRKVDEAEMEDDEQEWWESLVGSDNLTEDNLPPHIICTGCGKKVKPASQKLLQHPVLCVLVCKKCNKFYNSSSFSRDKFGMEEFCKWCGDGGDLICCDFCEKVFCQRCVKRNMGENFLKILLDADEEKWKCFCCDPSQIGCFTEECSIVMKIMKRLKMRGYAFEKNKTHLGGPSQFERKERLKNISHAYDDAGGGPNNSIKIEIDPDLDLSAQELSKCIVNKKQRNRDDRAKREVVDSNDQRYQPDTQYNSKKANERSSHELYKSYENAGKNTLKKLNVLLRRVEIPINCILPDFSGSPKLVSSKARLSEKGAGSSSDSFDIVNIISDSDSDQNIESSRRETVSKDNSLSTNESGFRSRKNKIKSVEEEPETNESNVNSEEEESESESDTKDGEDDSVDDAVIDDYCKEEVEDVPDLEVEEELNALEESSDSDYDYQRLRRRTIRRDNDKKGTGKVSKKLEKSSDTDDVNNHKIRSNSSDESLLLGRKRKRKKVVMRKYRQDSLSGSDSDFVGRIKKRPKRKRMNSDVSSDSEDERKANYESAEENGNVGGRRKRKIRGKDNKGKGKGRGKEKGKGNGKGKGRKNRNKVLDTDSNESSDDEKSPSKNKGRKNIRRILGDEELTEETRRARQLEEERRKRLLERTQATYIEEQARRKHDMTGRVILEMDKKEGEALVEIHYSLVSNLKPHQVEGIQFMYDCLFESVEKFKNGDKGNGALLAHCMGLGKSLQVIALLHAVANNPHIGLTKFLIVAPLNTVYNWENEFEKWLEFDQRMDVHVLTDSGSNLKLRMSMLKDWYDNGGVMILGYDMYRNLTQFKRIRSKRHKKIIAETLLDPGPDIVICDEGHILRNDLSAISKALTKIKTLRRVVLTGTPLQNNLIEYFVMVSFVKPNLLGTKKEFTNLFMNPIQNGQCANSTPGDVKVMKQRCHVLHDTLSGCVQRKDYSVLTPFLTPKHEYTLFVRLGERQRKMYQYYLDTFVCGNLSEVRARGSGMFADYQCLMKIWTHPWAVKLEAIRRLEREHLDDMREFLNDSESESESSEDDGERHEDKWRSSNSESDSKRESSESGSSEGSDEEERELEREDSREPSFKANTNHKSQPSASFSLRSKQISGKSGDKNSRAFSLNNGRTQIALDRDVFDAGDSEEETMVTKKEDNDEVVVVIPKEEPARHMGSTRSGATFKEFEEPLEDIKEKEWYDEFIQDGDDTNVELSGKLVLLLEILANAEIVGDKILVFSQSLSSLDLIERTLGGGRIGGNELSWCKGVDYFRIDGSTAARSRQRFAEIFNDISNPTARLFLISTRAGSLGVNLVAANRVIVFDCSWNPSHDVQSIFRVYRFGQDKPVYVYRFISQGTMEEKIYERQINKLALAGRVVDEQQISRHFTDEEIKELYAFTAQEYKEDDDIPVPQLPVDPLLAEVLQRQHPKWIVKYHEHDILLENIEDEQLTEEERKQAWANYEEQKDSAVRAVAKEAERLRLYQERVQAFQQQQQQQQQQKQLEMQQRHQQLQQQQQQILEMQRRLQQQQQQRRLHIDSQIHQHQDLYRRLNLGQQHQVRPTGYPPVKLEPGQVAQHQISSEERHRELQIINLAGLGAGLRAGLSGYRPWIPSNRGTATPLSVRSSLTSVDQHRPRTVDVVSINDPSMRQAYPHIPPSRSDSSLQAISGIRIANVGSLQRNASFTNSSRTYVPPRR